MINKLRLEGNLLTTVRQEVRELYASIAFADMAYALAALFEPIILYKIIGLDIIQILLYMAAIYAFKVLLLPLGASIASRFGYMHTIFLSIPFMALYWLLIYGAQFDFKLLYFAPLVYGIEKALFWPAFHASAARYVDKKNSKIFENPKRDGLYIMVVVIRILGPAIGGLVGFYLGLGVVLLLSTAMYLTALLPLLVSKEIYAPSSYNFDDTWQIYKKYPKRFLSHFGSGEELIIMTIWPVFIFLFAGNVAVTGILVTVSGLLTALLLFAIKRPTDLNSKLAMLKVGTFVYTLVNLTRIAVSGLYGVFMADALGRTTRELIGIPLNTLTYERADRNKILPYIVFSQQSAALGKCIAAVLAVVVFGLTGSLVAVFVLAGAFTMLYMLA